MSTWHRLSGGIRERGRAREKQIFYCKSPNLGLTESCGREKSFQLRDWKSQRWSV
jgi:hypothetical protein